MELVVSRGPEPELSAVITFVGMPLEEAKKAAEETLKLVVSEVTEEFSEDTEAGIVTWQSIDPNTRVEEGTAIRFRVSKGPDPSVEPTPPPTPSDTPENTPGSDPLVTSSVRVDLPRDGRTEVEVVVTVDGVEQYREVVNTQLQLKMVPVQGRGIQTVTVYIDGEESWSRPVTFG